MIWNELSRESPKRGKLISSMYISDCDVIKINMQTRFYLFLFKCEFFQLGVSGIMFSLFLFNVLLFVVRNFILYSNLRLSRAFWVCWIFFNKSAVGISADFSRPNLDPNYQHWIESRQSFFFWHFKKGSDWGWKSSQSFSLKITNIVFLKFEKDFLSKMEET